MVTKFICLIITCFVLRVGLSMQTPKTCALSLKGYVAANSCTNCLQVVITQFRAIDAKYCSKIIFINARREIEAGRTISDLHAAGYKAQYISDADLSLRGIDASSWVQLCIGDSVLIQGSAYDSSKMLAIRKRSCPGSSKDRWGDVFEIDRSLPTKRRKSWRS